MGWSRPTFLCGQPTHGRVSLQEARSTPHTGALCPEVLCGKEAPIMLALKPGGLLLEEPEGCGKERLVS